MFLPLHTRIYLAVGSTDMRKAINGLSILVEDQMDLDPFSGHLFVFCNRRRNMVKILYWDRNGFCLCTSVWKSIFSLGPRVSNNRSYRSILGN